jgi:hypothetical protein
MRRARGKEGEKGRNEGSGREVDKEEKGEGRIGPRARIGAKGRYLSRWKEDAAGGGKKGKGPRRLRLY